MPCNCELKVAVGLTEVNSSALPGLWIDPACMLTAYRLGLVPVPKMRMRLPDAVWNWKKKL